MKANNIIAILHDLFENYIIYLQGKELVEFAIKKVKQLAEVRLQSTLS